MKLSELKPGDKVALRRPCNGYSKVVVLAVGVKPGRWLTSGFIEQFDSKPCLVKVRDATGDPHIQRTQRVTPGQLLGPWDKVDAERKVQAREDERNRRTADKRTKAKRKAVERTVETLKSIGVDASEGSQGLGHNYVEYFVRIDAPAAEALLKLLDNQSVRDQIALERRSTA